MSMQDKEIAHRTKNTRQQGRQGGMVNEKKQFSDENNSKLYYQIEKLNLIYNNLLIQSNVYSE